MKETRVRKYHATVPLNQISLPSPPSRPTTLIPYTIAILQDTVTHCQYVNKNNKLFPATTPGSPNLRILQIISPNLIDTSSLKKSIG
jgi:hypothetical protein